MRAFCTACGAPMEADDRHCPRCGRPQTGPLVVRAIPEDEAPPPPLPEPPAPGRPRRGLPRVAALGAGALVAVFLVGLALGHCTAPNRGSQLSAAAPAGPSSAPGASTPSLSPSANPTPTPTPASPAQFTRAGPTNVGHCTIANGCPVSGSVRNQGPARGGGTVKFDLTSEDRSTVYASCTAPIPPTDPGATADVSCTANSDQLGNLFRQGPGNVVYVQVSTS